MEQHRVTKRIPATLSDDDIFNRLESDVRVYCRSFPVVFKQAAGVYLFDETGRRYIDFLTGAGVLNYGHNDPDIAQEVVDYIRAGGIVHSLDLHTTAKRRFLDLFDRLILRPRDLNYKIQFAGPTGTNSVEAALKLARRITGRTSVIAFTNGYHGVSLGALAATGNAGKRQAAGIPLSGIDRMPFDGYFSDDTDTAGHLEQMLSDPGSGLDAPAAIILETIQAEGGVRVASDSWLRSIADVARRHGALLIVDDIQAGCGRTGTFFSFERAGLKPDLVCLSKAIGGLGLPMSIVLISPGLDQWRPGEHNGTFRGNNLAFVAGAAALERFWSDDTLQRAIQSREQQLVGRLNQVAACLGDGRFTLRGRGLIQGLAWEDPSVAGAVSVEAFQHGLIVETCGPRDEVLKLLPPLTITADELAHGLDVLDGAIQAVYAAPPVSTLLSATV